MNALRRLPASAAALMICMTAGGTLAAAAHADTSLTVSVPGLGSVSAVGRGCTTTVTAKATEPYLPLPLELRFLEDENFLGSSVTDAEGNARFDWTPAFSGVHRITALYYAWTAKGPVQVRADTSVLVVEALSTGSTCS
ncbi:hypothetical protein H0264_37915 [Nocardia huaxiensis]|uniref:Ig-like domain-containing protein n=1 Tax=Nocardia huaxiensis TaxID=2755382 RepID=A0A7D6Z4A2_9NOCA|nr:hypothetical protein [Nocardia huaxiensis]QLY30804.1 hypothetical protein H0264_37915 [Nocardia huaxiensis]